MIADSWRSSRTSQTGAAATLGASPAGAAAPSGTVVCSSWCELRWTKSTSRGRPGTKLHSAHGVRTGGGGPPPTASGVTVVYSRKHCSPPPSAAGRR